MSMGEEDEEGTGPDDEFKEDDISSLAHAELEQHREMREYARLAAWEMPLLSSKLPTQISQYFGLRTELWEKFADYFHRTGKTIRATRERSAPPVPLYDLPG
jgi:hypothetical protein